MLRSHHASLLALLGITASLIVVPVACGGGGTQTSTENGTSTSAGGSSPGSTASTSGGGTGTMSSSSSGGGTGGTTATGSTSSASSSSSSSSSGGTSQSVRFAALGDVGKGNQGQKDVALAIAAKCAQSGCDFVQLLGDNIYDSGVDGTDDPQWQEKFEVPYAPVDLPFWVVLGNHDYGGDGAGNEFGKGKNEIDYSMISPKWHLPAAYYKHSMKHVEFFGLDTNMAMYKLAGQQKTDVAGWISASQAKWKIAFGHHPYLSNGPHGNAGAYEGLPFVPFINGEGVKELLDDAVCGKADVYICGHDHSLQLLQGKCGGTTELILSGAGAATSELPGSNATHYQTLDLSFVYVAIVDNTLTVEVVDTAGNTAYTRTITK